MTAHPGPVDLPMPQPDMPRLGSRLVDDAECVASVLLAILFAHLIGASNVSWAAFSGYMVMRGHALDSLTRGTLRIVGTACGAVLALAIVPSVASLWPLASAACAIVGTISLYGSLTRRHSYAWLFIGLTFEMILLDQMEHQDHVLRVLTLTRVTDVVAGTLACVLVSTLSTLTLRRRWPAARVVPPLDYVWQPAAFRHAALGGAALALLAPIGRFLGIHELAQSAISIMAVMLVPIASLDTGGLRPVSQKIGLRFLGCTAGAALALLVLFLARGEAPLLIAGTIVGVLIGRHIENGPQTRAYIGTQFTLAVLVTLVPDSYAAVAADPALDRLYSILIGLVLLEPVLIAWYLIRPRKPGEAVQIASTAGPGEE